MAVDCPECGDSRAQPGAPCPSCGSAVPGDDGISAVDTQTVSRPLIDFDAADAIIDFFEAVFEEGPGLSDRDADAAVAALALVGEIDDELVEDVLDTLEEGLAPASLAAARGLLERAAAGPSLLGAGPAVTAHFSPGANRFTLSATVSCPLHSGRAELRFTDRVRTIDPPKKRFTVKRDAAPLRFDVAGGGADESGHLGVRLAWTSGQVQAWKGELAYRVGGDGAGSLTIEAHGESVVYLRDVDALLPKTSAPRAVTVCLVPDLDETWEREKKRLAKNQARPTPPPRLEAHPAATALFIHRREGAVVQYAFLHGMRSPLIGRSRDLSDVPIRDPEAPESAGVSRKSFQVVAEGPVLAFRGVGRSVVKLKGTPLVVGEDVEVPPWGSLSFERPGKDLRWSFQRVEPLEGRSPVLRFKEGDHDEGPIWHLCTPHGGFLGPDTGLLELGVAELVDAPLLLKRRGRGWMISATGRVAGLTVAGRPLAFGESSQGLQDNATLDLPDGSQLEFHVARRDVKGSWQLEELLKDRLSAHASRLLHLVAE